MDNRKRTKSFVLLANEAAALPEVVGYLKHGTPAFVQTNLALSAAGFATFALLYCVQPLLPALSVAFGVTPAGASLSLSLTTALLAVSLPLASSLSDMWGRKPTMVASLLLSAGLGVISALLTDWVPLLLVRAAMGITLSGLPAVAMAYVGEEMDPNSMGLAMGLYVGGTAFGGMSGRLLTGIITDLWGWRTAILVMGLLAIGCGLIVWHGLPASRHFVAPEPRLGVSMKTLSLHLRDEIQRLLFAEGFLLMGSFVTIYNYIGYRLLAPPFSLSQKTIASILTVYLFGMLGSASVGNLATKLGPHRIFRASILVALIGHILTLSHRLSLIIAGIAILTFGFFASHALASSWVSARAHQAKAQASSLYLLAYYLGSSVAGSVGGIFWTCAGWPGLIAFTAALLSVAIALPSPRKG